MTTRKRVISIISIISLILVITAGVLLSVGTPNNDYVGHIVRASKTDVIIKTGTYVKMKENSYIAVDNFIFVKF